MLSEVFLKTAGFDIFGYTQRIETYDDQIQILLLFLLESWPAIYDHAYGCHANNDGDDDADEADHDDDDDHGDDLAMIILILGASHPLLCKEQRGPKCSRTISGAKHPS